MPEILGHAPILFGLLLNNHNKNNGVGVICGTVVLHEQISEACYLGGMGKFRVFPEFTTAARESLPFLSIQSINPIAKFTFTHKSGSDTTDQSSEAGVLHLRGKSADPHEFTQEHRDFYNKNGYVIFPDVLTAEESSSLLNDARDVMTRISKGRDGIMTHDISTSKGKPPSPIGRVLATFETANTKTSKFFERPIARLGCGIHQCMPSFRTLTHSPLHQFIAQSLGYGKPLVTQSQLIAKLAGVGGSIVPHQDGCISFTSPASGLTFWYALEDATIENGCLCVAPGSHLTEPLRQRLTKGDHGVPKFEDLKVPLWAREGADKSIKDGPMEYKYEPLEVKRGGLVLFHGNLMHTSGSNRSQKSRMAYTFSIIDGNAECPEDSYMKPVEGDFESL